MQPNIYKGTNCGRHWQHPIRLRFKPRLSLSNPAPYSCTSKSSERCCCCFSSCTQMILLPLSLSLTQPKPCWPFASEEAGIRQLSLKLCISNKYWGGGKKPTGVRKTCWEMKFSLGEENDHFLHHSVFKDLYGSIFVAKFPRAKHSRTITTLVIDCMIVLHTKIMLYQQIKLLDFFG